MKRIRFCRSGLLLVMLGGLAGVASAENYRWRDAEGRPHFGDSPPVGVKAERLTVHKSPSPLSPEEAKQQVQRLRDVEATKRASAAAVKAQAAAEAKRKTESTAALRARCDRARWALAALESGRPVYRDEQGLYRVKRPPPQADAYTGKRDYLEPAARERDSARFRRELTENCAAFPEANDKQRADDELRTAEACEAAYAELKTLRGPDSHAAPEELASRQAFISNNCGPSAR